MGEIITGYFAGRDGVDVRDILKMLRLVESMSVGAGLPEAMHGAGSSAAQKIMIARRSGIEDKSSLAETVVGIRRDKSFEKIVGKPEKDYTDEVAAKLKGQKVEICRRITT
jgi:4-hydroxybutyryl-CoA dehydratase/vinylacetyl-CoA-Delta-isomerase